MLKTLKMIGLIIKFTVYIVFMTMFNVNQFILEDY